MSELAPLISDLALILICAGVMTLIFKRLKQPLVLGYIVAGFLASPHFALTPSVIDTASIHTWSEIGVIFLLFALGLGICWAIQWVVFTLALEYCPELAAQAIGMVVYTMCNYLYNRLITFHTAPH